MSQAGAFNPRRIKLHGRIITPDMVERTTASGNWAIRKYSINPRTGRKSGFYNEHMYRPLGTKEENEARNEFYRRLAEEERAAKRCRLVGPGDDINVNDKPPVTCAQMEKEKPRMQLRAEKLAASETCPVYYLGANGEMQRVGVEAYQSELPWPRLRRNFENEWPTKLVERVVQRWVYGPSEDLAEGESELVDELVWVGK